MSIQHFYDAALKAANERDDAADLQTLASARNLIFDADEGDYPKFRDAKGRIVVGRCSDLRWRWFDHDSTEPSFTDAATAFESREVKS